MAEEPKVSLTQEEVDALFDGKGETPLSEEAVKEIEEYVHKAFKVFEDHENRCCFLCKHDLKTAEVLVAIGTKGLIICPDCLENIDADKASVFSITKDDIERCKSHLQDIFMEDDKATERILAFVRKFIKNPPSITP